MKNLFKADSAKKNGKKMNGLKKAATYATALACMAGVLGNAANVYAEEVTSEEAAVSEGRTVPHYDIREIGGTFDGTHYIKADGTLATECFFCDGTYTYYLQNDGTPMTDRLTYHPDGEHVIYFDSNGHEVFSEFANVKQSIAGDPVDDLCFFDTFGYMYVDFVTYDKAGVNLYYANPYGVLERNGWFTFSEKQGGGIGYANADGTLAVNQYTYDQNGNLVYLQGNGKVEGSETGTGSGNAESGSSTGASETGVPMGISIGDQGETVYWARGSFNPNVIVCKSSVLGDTGSHGEMEFHDGYITYGGYSYPIANINATSANFHGVSISGFETGNSWYQGVDFAGVFIAQGYITKEMKEAGFTEDNVIIHFVKNGIYDYNYLGSSKFYISLYYENYKDTGLYDIYGCDMTYYVLDYLAYGYAEGKTNVTKS